MRTKKKIENSSGKVPGRNLDFQNWVNSLIENFPVLICRYLPDTTVTYANQTYCKFFNVSSEKIIGKKWIELLSNQEVPFVKTKLNTFHHKMEPCKIQNRFILPTGKARTIEWLYSPVEDSSGNFLNEYQGIGIDITEKEITLAELKQKEKQLELFFLQLLDGFFFMNLDEPIEWNVKIDKEAALNKFFYQQKTTKVNDAFLSMYGMTKDEMIGMSPADFFKHNISYGKEVVKQILDKSILVIVTDERTKEGKQIWIEGNYFLFKDEEGKIYGLFGIQRDITEQKFLEETLKESEESYHGLFNAVSDAIYIQDETGAFLDVNKGAEKMYGYNREEFIGRTPLFLSAPGKNNFDNVKSFIQTTFETGVSSLFEFWGLKKNGEIFPKEVILNKGTYFGKPAIIAIARDITERKIFEETLKESEERYRNLFKDSPLGIYRTSPEGAVIMANPALIKMLGYNSYDDLVSIDIDKVYAENYSRSDFKKKIDETGKVVGYESAWYKKDGSIIYVRENARAVKDPDGRIIYYEGTIEDITEKKIVEEMLMAEKQLFFGGPVLVFKWKNVDGWPVEYVSPNIISVLGYTAEELMSGKIVYPNLIHPGDQERVENEMIVYSNSGVERFEQEYRLRDVNNIYGWYHDYTRIVRNDEGEIIYYHGYLFDITARKEAEEALIKSEQTLRNTNVMKDKFFSIIAHDLRSPFQGLLGMASILSEEEEISNEERIQLNKKLYEGLKTQFNLLDNLLTWSRVQRDIIEFNPELGDLAVDIKDTVLPLQSSIERKNLYIECRLPETLQTSFDKNMITAVMRNIISNAVKFTRQGGKIIISAEENEKEVTVSVSDTGIGIAQNDLEKLFRIDAHFSSKGTDGEGGTGLGLILCKDFIEKHNGKIWVESKVGKGSVFSFVIPKQIETSEK